jgi:dolichol-phosphate mannosyltransferase
VTVVARAPKARQTKDAPSGAGATRAATASTTRPYLSVVVPTYNERDNVAELLRRLAEALPPRSEVVIVDDSTDGTAAKARLVAAKLPTPVRVRHRNVAEGGLGGAVVEGFRLARGEWIVVMDADLQHPPASVADLVVAGDWTGADIVVASRYVGDGSGAGLDGAYRRLVSRSSTWLARLAFPETLRGVSDPMSGFFAIRAGAVDLDQLKPDGFKILMECLVRSGSARVVEVPYEFGHRHAGESKSSIREGLRFLRHLAELRRSVSSAALRPRWERTVATVGRHLCELRDLLAATVRSGAAARLLTFAAVGGSGVLVNLAVLQILTAVAGLHYLPAAIIANQFAVVSNFLLTERLVFAGRQTRTLLGRFGRFAALSNVDLVARIPMLAVLVGVLGLGYLTGTVLTLGVMFVLRFLVLDRLVYVGKPKSSSPSLEAI